MTDRQRLFVQKGQVDTQWEMIGGRDFETVPSSEIVNEYDTTTAQGEDTANAGYGGAGNLGQKNEAGEPVWLQVDNVETQESYVDGPRFDTEVSESYPDNWDDL